MNINQNKINYINSKIFEFVELLEETVEKPGKDKPKPKGSMQYDENILDITPYMTNQPITISEKLGTFIYSKKQCIDLKCLGLNRNNYSKFKKFLQNVYKEKSISLKVSFDYIENISFNYIVEIKRNNKAIKSYSNYLIENIELKINNYTIYFKILHLDINKKFKLGNVDFIFVDDNFFKAENSEELYQNYKGAVLVSYSVEAEEDKAKEIAYKKCSLAIDCLKICFDTVVFPEIKTSFDIDSRTKENLKNEIIVINSSDQKDLKLNQFRIPNHNVINDEAWKKLNLRGLPVFNNFLNQIENKDKLSEIELLIINSIQLFAYSISISDLNKRIVELFTILESLLLPDNNSPIIDNLTTYLSKLSTKNIEERRYIIKLTKILYSIRSSYVHHAIKKEIDLIQMSKFQVIIHLIILKFIDFSKNKDTKKSVLDEIDNAILKAY